MYRNASGEDSVQPLHDSTSTVLSHIRGKVHKMEKSEKRLRLTRGKKNKVGTHYKTLSLQLTNDKNEAEPEFVNHHQTGDRSTGQSVMSLNI